MRFRFRDVSFALVKLKNRKDLLKRRDDDTLAGSACDDDFAVHKNEHGDGRLLQPENESRENLGIELCSPTGSTETKTKCFEAKRSENVARCDHVVNGHALDFASRIRSLADATDVHANALFEVFKAS